MPTKSQSSRCFRFLSHAVMRLHYFSKISSSIKTSSVKQMELFPIMAGRVAVKFHHQPNSGSYSTNKLQFDLFQYNSKSRCNLST